MPPASPPPPAQRLVAVADLAAALGGGMLRVSVAGAAAGVDDLTLAEPAQGVVGQRGDLVLGVGVGDPEAAADLVGRAAEAGAAAIVLRRGLARRRVVRDSARRGQLTLVELAEHASWAHIVWLLRGVLDRAATEGEAGGSGGHDDLFALADAAANLADAAVTIEDAHSRVLAYSSRQDVTDPARVSTIVGRRVPEAVLASLRSRGVFRRLARSSEPFFVPADPDGTALPRLVVPVRAGGEWLGSIWAVVERRPPADVVRELSQTASVVALHLLRLRAQADLARRVSADRLRAALTGNAAGAESWLPPGPWRVVCLSQSGAATATREQAGERAARQLDLWESVFRRRSWHQPLLADLDGWAYAVVWGEKDAQVPGSWGWLRTVAAGLGEQGEGLTAAAGSSVVEPASLARSRAEATEVAQLIAAGRVARPVAALEDVWAEASVSRAAEALRAAGSGGPLEALGAHDDARGTAYLRTLAAWLDHPGEPARAAADLHIHANTLRYRMQRLGEVVRLDLDSPAARLALRLQLASLGFFPSTDSL
jgi:hypothetical protein